jgi:small subunit ribosomal protein S17
MADETTDTPEPEETPEAVEETTAEETPAAEETTEEAPQAAEEAPAAEAPAPVAPSTPAERKIAARARRGKRRPSTPEERLELRKAKAAARTRRRASEKAKRAKAGVKGEGTPPAEHGTGTQKVRLGIVTSDKADKTITVRIDVARRHRKYQKIVRSSSTVHAHDEANDAHEGDLVRVVEARPMSATKRWRLTDVLERSR